MLPPRKRFGQHFLQDPVVIQKMLTMFDPKPEEHVIEIGPGQGILTFPLLKILNHLEVIELDRDLVSLLQMKAGDKLLIHAADVLTIDFASLKKDARLLRVIGNLPYNISTPLIFHLLESASSIRDMLVMLQKEVAERVTAKVNTKEYGRLSVMVQYHCETKRLFDVPPNAFNPPPQVESSVVQLIPHQSYPYKAKDEVLFQRIVKEAFGQRRKMLRNSLKEIVEPEMWSQVSIDPMGRAENVSIKEFVELANAMAVG